MKNFITKLVFAVCIGLTVASIIWHKDDELSAGLSLGGMVCGVIAVIRTITINPFRKDSKSW